MSCAFLFSTRPGVILGPIPVEWNKKGQTVFILRERTNLLHTSSTSELSEHFSWHPSDQKRNDQRYGPKRKIHGKTEIQLDQFIRPSSSLRNRGHAPMFKPRKKSKSPATWKNMSVSHHKKVQSSNTAALFQSNSHTCDCQSLVLLWWAPEKRLLLQSPMEHKLQDGEC